jgi:HK97 family phage major capsid protein
MEIKDLETKLSGVEAEIRKFIDKHAEEMKLRGEASAETKAALDKLGKEWKELSARLLNIEQTLVARGGATPSVRKTIGEMVVESDGFRAIANGANSTGKIKVGNLHKAVTSRSGGGDATVTPAAGATDPILNASGQNQPLVPDYRVPGILGPGLRRLTVRDLLSVNRTTSNLIQYTKENVFYNSAGPQPGENQVKPQSSITFSLANAPVQTLGHWIAASRQILDDAPALSDYIDNRLMYGLKLVEEDQLLKGDGTGQNLSGLITNSTAYSRAKAGDTAADTVRRAKTQVADSFFEADGVILHPHDWEAIELIKETTGGYILSNPATGAERQLWGLSVVATPAITVGNFLVGAFKLAASIWDRQDATVEVSREPSDFFIRNMVAILAEERLALTVFRPQALVYGQFSGLGS